MEIGGSWTTETGPLPANPSNPQTSTEWGRKREGLETAHNKAVFLIGGVVKASLGGGVENFYS